MPDPHIKDQTAESVVQMLMGAAEAVISPHDCLVTQLDARSFTITQHNLRNEVVKQFIVRVEQDS